MKRQVFISHSYNDIGYARKIAGKLAEVNVTAFTGSELPEGTDWINSIEESLDKSTHVVVLVSEDWEKSKWAEFELGAAYGMGKTIIPIFLTKHHGNIPKILRDFDSIDASEEDDNTVAKEIQKIVTGNEKGA